MNVPETADSIDFTLNTIEKIMHAINEDESYVAMNETDLLLKTLDSKYKKEKKLDELELSIANFLKNPKNSRLLRLLQKVKREIDTGIEYYDEDIGNDHRLFYQNDLEEDVNIVYEKIRAALASIIKDKLGNEINF